MDSLGSATWDSEWIMIYGERIKIIHLPKPPINKCVDYLNFFFLCGYQDTGQGTKQHRISHFPAPMDIRTNNVPHPADKYSPFAFKSSLTRHNSAEYAFLKC